MKILLVAVSTTAIASGCNANSNTRRVLSDSHCYTFQDPVASAAAAEEHCETLGGTLAYPDDIDTFALLNNFATKGAGDEATRDTWWLGLIATDGCAFKPLGNTSSIDELYSNFTTSGDFDCGSCDGDFSDDGDCCITVNPAGDWNIVPCEESQDLPYFCKTQTCYEICTETNDCVARGGYHAEGMCYTLQEPSSSMQDAESVCEGLGGHVGFSSNGDMLAAMNSMVQEEEDGASWWLGLAASDGCTFDGLDGSKIEFTNWASTEPNNCASCQEKFDSDGECCASTLSDTTWSNTECTSDDDSPLYYFCELPLCDSVADTTPDASTNNPCLEDGEPDSDCCAVPSSAGCTDGYTYSYDDSDAGVCTTDGKWTGFTTVCTECVDEFDRGTMDVPWYDFSSCADEADYCDSSVELQVGCAATCGTCGENGRDALATEGPHTTLVDWFVVIDSSDYAVVNLSTCV